MCAPVNISTSILGIAVSNTSKIEYDSGHSGGYTISMIINMMIDFI